MGRTGQKSIHYLLLGTFAVTGGQNCALVFWVSLSPLKIWVLGFPPTNGYLIIDLLREGLWASLPNTLIVIVKLLSYMCFILTLFKTYRKVARIVQKSLGYLLPRSPICEHCTTLAVCFSLQRDRDNPFFPELFKTKLQCHSPLFTSTSVYIF